MCMKNVTICENLHITKAMRTWTQLIKKKNHKALGGKITTFHQQSCQTKITKRGHKTLYNKRYTEIEETEKRINSGTQKCLVNAGGNLTG